MHMNQPTVKNWIIGRKMKKTNGKNLAIKVE